MSAWGTTSARARLAAIGLLVLGGLLPAVACAAPDAATPDPAMLEFLGDWQAPAGGDIDPVMLDDPPPADEKRDER